MVKRTIRSLPEEKLEDDHWDRCHQKKVRTNVVRDCVETIGIGLEPEAIEVVDWLTSMSRKRLERYR